MIENSIQSFIFKAKEYRASDLLISVGKPPMIRRDAKRISLDLPQVDESTITSMIKEIVFEPHTKLLDENGEVECVVEIPGVGRVRANIFRHTGQYTISCRLIPNQLPSVVELGLPEAVTNLTCKKRGMILVTGPSASGKSTTLAALVDDINANRQTHIVTLEKPIEYIYKNKLSIVNQREIGSDTADYITGLQAAIKEHPDVIVIDELKGPKTFEMALTAAESGHLVLAGLHTTGVTNTINYLIGLFSQEKQQQIQNRLAYILDAVISQQLIPLQDETGSVAAFEIMRSGNAIRNLIREGKIHQIDSLLQTGQKQGMQTMDDAVYELYLKRKIDAATALDYAIDPFIFEKKL